MSTTIDEIAERVYRISTYTDEIPGGFTFNQFLLDGDEPLLFHTGTRGSYDDVAAAVASVRPVEELRWISFSHYEADESGALEQWLAAAPSAAVAVGEVGCSVSIADQADGPVRPLGDDEVIELGGHVVRWLATPHVPHGWDAGLLFDETTRTLLCSDLLSQLGPCAPVTNDDVIAAAFHAEDIFGATALTPALAPTLRRLAELQPAILGIMHGSSFVGDCAGALRAAADEYEARLRAATG